jgi:hypothetical protein
MGDVNGDGSFNVGDVAQIYSSARGTTQLTDEERSRADINGDGKVNVGDAAMLYSNIRNGN